MSKKIQLTEQEVSSIRGLYPLANKEVLNEQSTLEKIKKSYSEPCNGSNKIQEPGVRVKVVYDKNNIPIKANFTLKAYFGATQSDNEVYKKPLLNMKEQIYADLRSNKIDDDYKISLIKIEKVIGSASNYLNGPLQPTHSLYGTPMPPVRLEGEPYLSLPKEGNSKWNENMGYAESRWKKMVSFITNNGDSIGFSIGKQFKEPTAIESRITDTGGCTDEKRDTNIFRNSGQFVTIQGEVRLNIKTLTTTEIEQLKECGQGLKIIVGFFKEPETVDGIDIPKNVFKPNRGHACDYATFTVYCNGVPVGISNMNNGIGRLKGKDPKMLMGLKQKNVVYRAPKDGDKVMSNGKTSGYPGFGDTVYSVITVSEDKLDRIVQKSKDGKIHMKIRGTNGSATRNGGKVHGEAPMVCAYIIEGERTKRVYGPQEPFGSGEASLNIPVDKTASIGSFDPCVPIAIE